MNHTIIIGTRGSKLALAQVELTRQALLSAFPDIDVQVKIIKTIGDVMLDVPLSGSIAKGFFTSEIEAALFAGTIDLAVHSMKDLPVGLPEGLTIGGRITSYNVCYTKLLRESTFMESGFRLQSELRQAFEIRIFSRSSCPLYLPL